MSLIKNIIRDLGQKKLIPVVVALVLIAVAIPVLLKHDANLHTKGSVDVPTLPINPNASSKTVVTLSKQDDRKPGKLDAFKKRDPFTQQSSASSSQSSTSNSSTAGSTTTSPAGTGGSGSTTTSAGGATASSTARSSNGGVSSSSRSTASSGNSTRKRYYRLAATFEFGLTGKEKLKKDLSLLSPLPSSKNPVVVFLGVSQNSGAAVFLVSQGVTQKGEGTCRPTSANCQLVYLHEDTRHNQHTFYKDAMSKYQLRVVSIGYVPSSSISLKSP